MRSSLGVPSCAVVSRVVLGCSIQYWMLLFFLRFQLMLGTASLWIGSRTVPRFDDFVLSILPSMFHRLVAAFIAACVSVTLPFAIFATPGLDSVLLRGRERRYKDMTAAVAEIVAARALL
ncbi:hypothetical protein F2Q69_00004776 [Brassica cretica]|uniref:Uncharacterized protein n=1 Tax=Brassica cretica TaxID=69181 RepID=A0A8S9PAR8_BRACR|nr:hypothetical protein F2Q69_00004776 [Brassica cretica]